MLAGKKFSTNQEVITETEAYFDGGLKIYKDLKISENSSNYSEIYDNSSTILKFSKIYHNSRKSMENSRKSMGNSSAINDS
jgi:hypothetical protein